jgi:surface protein
VKLVTDMTNLFSKSNFNSNISNWNVSAVTDMRSMFSMATRFNQNLCPWGAKLPSNFNYVSQTINMFTGTNCTNKTKPTGRSGPWCAVTNCTA